MDDSIGYVMVAFIIIGTTYSLVRQIQHILIIQNVNKSVLSNNKRSLFPYYLACGSLFGFLISYMLNILVAIQLIQSNLVKSDTTALSSSLFLMVYIVTKWVVIPRIRGQHKLLKE